MSSSLRSGCGVLQENKATYEGVLLVSLGSQRGGWTHMEARERYVIGLWKAIRKGQILEGHLVQGHPLRTSFPSLFLLNTLKDALVCDTLQLADWGVGTCFLRDFKNQELDCIETLVLYYQGKLVSSGVDCRVGGMATKGSKFQLNISIMEWFRRVCNLSRQCLFGILGL